jgi:hypothetical protein
VESIYIFYPMAVWFLIILLLGDPKYRPHSAIIFAFAVVNIIIVHADLLDSYTYVERREFWINYDGAFAVFLTFFFYIDKYCLRQSILLTFAVFLHFGIIWTIEQSFKILPHFVYTGYEELIICVGILQMVTCTDGLSNALHRVRDDLQGWYYSRYRGLQSYSVLQKNKDLS